MNYYIKKKSSEMYAVEIFRNGFCFTEVVFYGTLEECELYLKCV